MSTFLLGEELQAFAQTLERFNADLSLLATSSWATEERPALVPDYLQRWESLAELGVFAAALPENVGGLGFGLLSSALVVEQLAGSRLPVPVLETLSAAAVLQCIQSAAANDLLVQISGGDCLVSIDFGLGGVLANVQATQVQEGDGGTLSGVIPYVASANLVDGVLLVVNRSATRALYYLPTAGLSLEYLPTIDIVSGLFRLSFQNAPATFLGEFSSETATASLDSLAVLTAAEFSGLAGTVLEMTTQYLLTRKQFSKPLASFQALQHRLAEMKVVAEQVHSLSRVAAWSFDQDVAQRSIAALAASGFAGESVPKLVEQAIQLHGGIGFTFEYPLHLYLRRAQLLARFVRTPSSAHAALGDLLLS